MLHMKLKPNGWPARARGGGAGGREEVAGVRTQQAHAAEEMRGTRLLGISAAWGRGRGVVRKASYIL